MADARSVSNVDRCSVSSLVIRKADHHGCLDPGRPRPLGSCLAAVSRLERTLKPPGPANYRRGTLHVWMCASLGQPTESVGPPSSSRVCVGGLWRLCGAFRCRACEPTLAVERSTRSASVCVISIREIFVFEYQPQRLPQQLATAVRLDMRHCTSRSTSRML